MPHSCNPCGPRDHSVSIQIFGVSGCSGRLCSNAHATSIRRRNGEQRSHVSFVSSIYEIDGFYTLHCGWTLVVATLDYDSVQCTYSTYSARGHLCEGGVKHEHMGTQKCPTEPRNHFARPDYTILPAQARFHTDRDSGSMSSPIME